MNDVQVVSELGVFTAQEITIHRGSADHDRFMKFLTEAFPALTEATVVATKECEPVRVCTVNSDDELAGADLPAPELTVLLVVSADLFADPDVDNPGYLLMTGARAIGNQLRAQVPDGDGDIGVRFGNDLALTVKRVPAEPMASGTQMLGYRLGVHGAAGRCQVLPAPGETADDLRA